MAFPAFAQTNQVAIELDTVSDEARDYMPGEDADYKVTLKNLLGPSWVRVKFGFKEKNIDSKVSDADLNLSDDWVKRGDYFYYTEKAEAYTDYLVVDGFSIPDMNEVPEDASITITVDADAVQYSSFDPDFSKEEPWEGAEIKHSSSSSGVIGGSSGPGSSQVHIFKNPTQSPVLTIGEWVPIDIPNKEWEFKASDGTIVKNGWIYVQNPWSETSKTDYNWYCFDENGRMKYGWIKDDSGVWYYTNEISDGDLGTLKKGWHSDPQDGRKYYLDPVSGIMLSGWQEIDDQWYYFATVDDIPSQTWFWDTGLGEWIYRLLGFRSYGSMYVNESTPDGQAVDEKGVRV